MSPTDHPPFLGVWTDSTESGERAAREPLSRSRIVAAAVRILDRHGVEGLSMRTLAEELHTAATSLYRHVHDKGELLDLTVDALMAEVQLPPADADWRTAMRTVSLNFRAVLMGHRDAAVLHGSRMAIGPNTLRLMEFVCTKLLDAGFSEEEAAAAGATVINYTVGCVLGEVMPTSALEASGYTWEQFAAEMSRRVEALPLDRYPTMRKMLPMLLGHHHDQPFEYGLDALLDGLAARRAAPAPADTALRGD
jgi:TetR/AcrR family transcriptional regulator, tetracycline repressor protein